MPIHPLAVVDPTARLGQDVSLGPFSVVEAGAELGDRCRLESHACVKAGTKLGSDNHVFEGAVVGGLPQHAKIPTESGGCIVGSNNVIRENVTIHRACDPTKPTRVGSRNLLMAGSHVAHDCTVGDQTIFANGAVIGGHVIVEDRAYISGNVAIHQHCRIGSLAMIGGLGRVVRDVPPFMMVDGQTGLIVGLNFVGLSRAGWSTEEVAVLKRAYRVIYRSALPWVEILQRLRTEFAGTPAERYADWLAATKRGLTQDRRPSPRPTLKLVDGTSESDAMRETSEAPTIAMRRQAG